jgi:hypothetical protein
LEDLLIWRLRHLYPDFVSDGHHRKWFIKHGLSDFAQILELEEVERQDLASMSFDCIEGSSKKISIFEEVFKSALENMVAEDITKGIIPVMIGSVARFESEHGGDCDVDFIVDQDIVQKHEIQMQIGELLAFVNAELEKIKAPAKLKKKPLEDYAIYTLQEVLDPNDTAHFTNLLVGHYALKDQSKVVSCITTAKSEIPKKNVLKELRERISDELTQTKDGRKAVKIGFTISNYVVRMLALGYLDCKDVDKNYWRICELLKGKIDSGFLKEIAYEITIVMYGRRREDRNEQVHEHVKLKIMRNAKSIFESMVAVMASELD